MFDFNQAEKQSLPETLIPHGTAVAVEVKLRPGGAGDGGLLKRSNEGTCRMLDLEFTIIDGEYARRKFWTLLTLEGETEGQRKAVGISRSRLRAMLESARGIRPTDETERATTARRVKTLEEFDGLRFWAVVGVAKGTDGYKDKNVLYGVLTPDLKGWTKLEQRTDSAGPVAGPSPAATPVSGGRPSWA